MKGFQVFAVLVALSVTGSVNAADTDIPEVQKARLVLTDYLNAVQGKKWQEVRKWTHPDTLQSIADRKKRTGTEDHPMAPWFHEKKAFYLKTFKVTAIRPAIWGTMVIETSEDNFMVEEKGVSQGDMASYLVGQKGGKWYVVDKRRQETFNDDSIKYGYKKYFDPVTKPNAASETTE